MGWETSSRFPNTGPGRLGWQEQKTGALELRLNCSTVLERLEAPKDTLQRAPWGQHSVVSSEAVASIGVSAVPGVMVIEGVVGSGIQ